MKLACALCGLMAVLLVAGAEAKEYTSKYDGIDVDRILQNGRVLGNYIKCMLEEGSCTPEGRELKSKWICYFPFFPSWFKGGVLRGARVKILKLRLYGAEE